MIKPVSTLSIIVAGVMCIVPTFGAQMTPQIQRLLDQKQEKIKKLEECEGKKQGWMIAGISTIGVTAVGVGLNIAQASKRNRLDDEIDTARHDLEVQERHLGEINSQIADRERENAKLECSQQEGMVWKNGQCVPVEKEQKSNNEESKLGQLDVQKNDEKPVTLELQIGGLIGSECGNNLEEITTNTKSGVWNADSNGQYNCKYNANDTGYTVRCSCGSVKKAGTQKSNVNTIGNPVGKIGGPCNNGGGKWELDINSDNYCTDDSGRASFKCACAANEGAEQNGAKKSVEKNLAMDAGLSVGIDLAIKNAQSNSVLNEENKDLNKLNSIGGTSGGINLDLPTVKESKPTKTEERLAAESMCIQTGGDGLNIAGTKCNCKKSRGLKTSDDNKTCVCEKTGYEYDKGKKKCVGPNIDKVEEILSDDKFLKDNFL